MTSNIQLKPNGDGVIVEYQWNTYRFLLDDGSTLDVVAIRDDSTLREAVLKHTKANRIEGVATVGPPPETPTKKPRKRGATPVPSTPRR